MDWIISFCAVDCGDSSLTDGVFIDAARKIGRDGFGFGLG
jgi:hypothetical protein